MKKSWFMKLPRAWMSLATLFVCACLSACLFSSSFRNTFSVFTWVYSISLKYTNEGYHHNDNFVLIRIIKWSNFPNSKIKIRRKEYLHLSKSSLSIKTWTYNGSLLTLILQRVAIIEMLSRTDCGRFWMQIMHPLQNEIEINCNK